VLKTLLSVLNIDKPHKDGTMKSKSEITMCDRMQMYNIISEWFSFWEANGPSVFASARVFLVYLPSLHWIV
jgi:hypothetical protein